MLVMPSLSVGTPRIAGMAASDYDGTNDYATKAGDLTGIADGRAGTFSGWVRLDGGNSSNMTILQMRLTTPHFRIRRYSGNGFSVVGVNSAGTIVLTLTTPSENYTSGGAWRHVLMSWDLTFAGRGHIYINDASDFDEGTFVVNGTIDYAAGSGVGIGANNDGSDKFNGCLSELFFHTTYIDLSVESNRRKFITAGGKPAYLGIDGSTPLGVRPLLYAPNGNPSVNRGSGGAFNVAGTLTSASTVPAGA